jgi:hypothetical protein
MADKTPMEKFRNSVGFQFMFVIYSGLEIDKAIDHICSAAEKLCETAAITGGDPPSDQPEEQP